MNQTPRSNRAALESIEMMNGGVLRECKSMEIELTAANDRIERLEEELMDTENAHAALVADVALYEDRAERIKWLEDIISRAASAFFRVGSDGQVASGMLSILEEVRKP